MTECWGSFWNEGSVISQSARSEEKMTWRVHTAQVFLLEEWYEADKEEEKKKKKIKKDG